MKMNLFHLRTRRLVLAMLVPLLVSAACREESRTATGLSIAEHEAVTKQEIRVLNETVEARLNAFDDQIEQLQAQVEDAETETQAEIARWIADFRNQQDALRTRLQRLENKTATYQSNRSSIQEDLYTMEAALEVRRLELIEEREAFQEAVQRRLHELDWEMKELMRRTQNAAAELPAEYNEQIAMLLQRREELTRRFDALTAAPPPDIRRLRHDLADALAAFKADVHKVADSLKRVGA